MRKTALSLIIVVLTISFIACSGCVELTKQLLEKNSTYEDEGAWADGVNSALNITERPVDVISGVSVILTFDDGYRSDYTVVYPELKARNMRSTHYIIASSVGASSAYMSWAEIKAMHADGFDMQCHSDTHPFLTTRSSDQIIKEMMAVNTAFVAQGIPAPRHTAYPYGDHNEDVISIVSQYRDSGRVLSWKNDTDYHTYPIGSLKKPYELPSYPTDLHDTITQIDDAIAGNYTLILCFHAVTDIPGQYNMPISEFVSILDHIESNNIPTQTISEYYKSNLVIPNVAPVASIDTIVPNPASVGDLIYLKGNGTDEGGAIKAYRWTLDGTEISTKASFITSTSDLAPGTHAITFSVLDNKGAWSDKETRTLTINEAEPPVQVPSGTSVILTFDDARRTEYSIVYPLLKERNIRSTHYIVASSVGIGPAYMSWDEIKAMYADGFDMQCHSNTHPSLTTMSSDQIIQEMVALNTAFVAQDMPAPRHTAYPYGDYNQTVISIVSQYRDSGRVVTWNDYSRSVRSLQKPYELPCYPTERHNTIVEIEKAIAGNYTLIVGFNQVIENPGQYDVSISEFVSILNYIGSNNVPTQTISEYYDKTFRT